MAQAGLTPVYPLWKRDTQQLARDMIASGLRAVVVCIDPKKLDARFAGRWFDEDFLNDLPDGIDPCGENGEFHTCVVDGPMFSGAIAVEVGETVERDGFVYADVMVV
jgi:diphthamide synthase (EF-2-diphthine--ammonia ligase)